MKHNLENRRQGVAKRLEAQLESGVKPVRKSTTGETTPLTEKDKKRINKELNILSKPTLKYRRKNRKYSKDGTKAIAK